MWKHNYVLTPCALTWLCVNGLINSVHFVKTVYMLIIHSFSIKLCETILFYSAGKDYAESDYMGLFV